MNSCSFNEINNKTDFEREKIDQSIDALRILVMSDRYNLIAENYCKDSLRVTGYLDSDEKLIIKGKKNIGNILHSYFSNDKLYVDGTRALLLNSSNDKIFYISNWRLQNSGKKSFKIGDMIFSIDANNQIYIDTIVSENL
jgi:hypothetical protein